MRTLLDTQVNEHSREHSASPELIRFPRRNLALLPLESEDQRAIALANAWIFPSPFSIEHLLAECLSVWAAFNHGHKPAKLPWIGLVGSGSKARFDEVCSTLPLARQCEVIVPQSAPYDAQHLAIEIARVKPSSEIPNIVSLGPKNPGVTLGDWKAFFAQIRFSANLRLIAAYESTEFLYSPFEFSAIKERYIRACMQDRAKYSALVYFTSSSDIEYFLDDMGWLSGGHPTAITIHGRISEKLAKFCYWPILQIEPGPEALHQFVVENL